MSASDARTNAQTDRVTIVLPKAYRDLADAIAKRLPGGSRSRSMAIRAALDVYAAQLGIRPKKPAK